MSIRTRMRSILLRRDDDRPARRRVAKNEQRSTAGGSDRAHQATGANVVPGAHAWVRPREAPQVTTRQYAALLQEQRTHGNAHAARLIQRGRTGAKSTPVAASPAEIADRARSAETDPRLNLAFAGTPLKKEPPDGMTFIANQSGPIGLGGKPAGYTAIKSAAAFTAPRFVTQMSAEKDGFKRRYFVEVQPTAATDVDHPSYYPAPGTHDNAVSEQKDGTYRYYWTISSKMSELIRKGEQEHLNDAQRAYDLTYGLIANQVNAMVGQRFGPAETPQAAEQLAKEELVRRLPAALGSDPLNWFNVLEAMLDMTIRRDRQHLHDVTPGKAVERGKTFYIPLVTTDQTSIDQVPSDQIVNYPSAGQGGPSGGTARGAAPDSGAEQEKGH